MKFLTMISHKIYYQIAQHVATTNAKEYIKRMDEIKTLYKQGGFNVTQIHCNNEFHKAMNNFSAIQQPPIKMNYASAQEYVPWAKRNNQTIKELIGQPYTISHTKMFQKPW